MPGNIFQYMIRRDMLEKETKKDKENYNCTLKNQTIEKQSIENQTINNDNLKKRINVVDNILFFFENESFMDIINN